MSRHIAGIFQGGGAKGVAYLGALKALDEAGIWFNRVGGASAGAITASLIAAGLDPVQIEAQMPLGLSELAGAIASFEGKGPWSKARLAYQAAHRHRRTGSIFDADHLELWLVGAIGLDEGARPTFASLYARTGIELQVVAANISRGEQVTFNHIQTPHADVAKAVLASSAIPAAFPPGHMISSKEQEPGAAVKFANEPISNASDRADDFVRETLIDGGVWANYPAFVFKDRSFRAWAGLPVDFDEPIVGFLLTPDDGPTITSATSVRAQKDARIDRLGAHYAEAALASFERAATVDRVEVERVGLSWRPSVAYFGLGTAAIAIGAIAGFAAAPVRLFLVLVGILLCGLMWFAWTTPKKGQLGLDQAAWNTSSIFGALAANAIEKTYSYWFLPLALVVSVAAGLTSAASYVSSLADRDGFWLLAGQLMIWGGLVLMSAALSATLLVALRFAAPTIGWSLPGTAKTLLAASTEPPAWVGEHEADRVLRIPVPRSVTTLKFNLTEAELRDIGMAAHAAVEAQLSALGLPPPQDESA